jgi:hypothetical protein
MISLVIEPVGSATTAESLELLRRRAKIALEAASTSVWTAGERAAGKQVDA